MGVKLIIKGADFSANAISLPYEYVGSWVNKGPNNNQTIMDNVKVIMSDSIPISDLSFTNNPIKVRIEGYNSLQSGIKVAGAIQASASRSAYIEKSPASGLDMISADTGECTFTFSSANMAGATHFALFISNTESKASSTAIETANTFMTDNHLTAILIGE